MQDLAAAIFQELASGGDLRTLSPVRERLEELRKRLTEADAWIRPLLWELSRSWGPLEHDFCGVKAASPVEAILERGAVSLVQCTSILAVIDQTADKQSDHSQDPEARRLLDTFATGTFLSSGVFGIQVKAMYRNMENLRMRVEEAVKQQPESEEPSTEPTFAAICEHLQKQFPNGTADVHKVRKVLHELRIPVTTANPWIPKLVEGQEDKSVVSIERLIQFLARRNDILRRKENARAMRATQQ